MQHDTTYSLIGIDANENRAAVGQPDRGLSQRPLAGVGLLALGVPHRISNLCPAGMIRIY